MIGTKSGATMFANTLGGRSAFKVFWIELLIVPAVESEGLRDIVDCKCRGNAR